MNRKTVLLTTLLALFLVILAGCTADKDKKESSEQMEQTVPKTHQTSTNDQESENQSQVSLLREIQQLAEQGKIINSEFPVKTTVIESVKEKWGTPDKEEYIAAAKGTYITYSKRDVVFGFNKGSQIFDVRSFDKRLNQITISDVEDTLGKPENVHHFAGEELLVYKAGEDYQLLFIFPKASKDNPAPGLDHYNIFYPPGSVNSMADDPGIKY